MILPDRPSDRRPRSLERKYALDSITLELLSRSRIQNSRLDTEERNGRGTRLGRDGTRKRSDDDRTGLSLPERIDNGALILADVLVVPMPSFGVDGFTDGAEYSKSGEIVTVYVLWTKTAKKTNGGGSAVEVGEFVLGDSLPVA